MTSTTLHHGIAPDGPVPSPDGAGDGGQDDHPPSATAVPDDSADDSADRPAVRPGRPGPRPRAHQEDTVTPGPATGSGEQEHTAEVVPLRAANAPANAPAPVPVLNGHGAEAEQVSAAGLAAGDVPSIRRIRAGLHCAKPGT
jgi:hypothetical protein